MYVTAYDDALAAAVLDPQPPLESPHSAVVLGSEVRRRFPGVAAESRGDYPVAGLRNPDLSIRCFSPDVLFNNCRAHFCAYAGTLRIKCGSR